MTTRTHQSSACQPRKAARQGCARVAELATGRSYLRSLPFQGKKGFARLFARLDTLAISLSNPEALP
jgi:hypothetical protein